MKDLMKMLKQAQDLQSRMQGLQEELATLEVEGQSGGGSVRVTLNGAHWQPGETVHIRVNDDTGASWDRDVDVTADEDKTRSMQIIPIKKSRELVKYAIDHRLKIDEMTGRYEKR